MCKDELIARKKIFIRFFSIKFNFVYNIFVNFFFFSAGNLQFVVVFNYFARVANFHFLSQNTKKKNCCIIM